MKTIVKVYLKDFPALTCLVLLTGFPAILVYQFRTFVKEADNVLHVCPAQVHLSSWDFNLVKVNASFIHKITQSNDILTGSDNLESSCQ